MYYMGRPRKRKSAKISEAVFLGKKSSYTFDVYPLSADLPASPSVFILSRRKVDKAGRASHAASCIGEAISPPAELKKHKRSKCVKHNAGNVVCILPDDSDQRRSEVVNDIIEARTFSCVRNVFEPTMLRKPNVHPTSSKKAVPAIPAISVDLPLKPKRRKRVAGPASSEKDAVLKNKTPAAASIPAVDKRVRTSAKAASAKAKKPKTAAAPAKRRAAAKPRTRVQSRVDRDGGQHRLSKQKRASAGRAKTRTAGRTGTRKKAAA